MLVNAAAQRCLRQLVARLTCSGRSGGARTCAHIHAVSPQELLELKREIKDGMYSPLAYILSNAILQV